MALEEPKIKKLVMNFLKEKGYLVIKEFELDGIKADIAAFKWKNDYEIEAVAVECKGKKSIVSYIEAAQKQARLYQVAFPRVYLAIPTIKDEQKEMLKTAIDRFRVGVITVDANKKIDKLPDVNFSLKLKEEDYLLKVRQRAVALSCFKESTKADLDKIKIKYNPYGIACWTVEQANYLITNEDIQTDKNYHFGVNVENTENIKKSIGQSSSEKFYKIIKNLPENYVLRVDYNHTYRPRPVYHPILIKPVNEIDIKDIEWMINYCKKNQGES